MVTSMSLFTRFDHKGYVDKYIKTLTLIKRFNLLLLPANKLTLCKYITIVRCILCMYSDE